MQSFFNVVRKIQQALVKLRACPREEIETRPALMDHAQAAHKTLVTKS